jgi:hypothetical protein
MPTPIYMAQFPPRTSQMSPLPNLMTLGMSPHSKMFLHENMMCFFAR